MSDCISICEFQIKMATLHQTQAVAEYISMSQFFDDHKQQIFSSLRHWIKNKIGTGKGKRHPKHYVKPIDVFFKYIDISPIEWRKLFGPFNPNQVLQMARTIDWSKFHRSKISCINMTLMFLHRMHKGCHLAISSAMFGMSPSVTGKIFDFILDEINDKYNHLISWPSLDYERECIKTLVDVSTYMNHCVCSRSYLRCI